MQDIFILSDMGWILLTIVAYILVFVVTWAYIGARGYRKVTTTRAGDANFQVRVSEKLNKSPMVVFILVGSVFIVTVLALFSFYYQVSTGIPYFTSESGNLVFVTVIVTIIVCLFTLAMALLKNLGALGMWYDIVSERGGKT